MVLFAKTLRASMTLWRRFDVRKFDADAILLREILCKRRGILMFKRRFQCGLDFIALTLAGPLGCCLNTRPNGLTASCSNSFHVTYQKLAIQIEKKMHILGFVGIFEYIC